MSKIRRPAPPFLLSLTALVLILLFFRETAASDPDEGATPPPGHLADDPERGIRWQPSFARALEVAQSENKPLYISFSVRKMANPASEHR